ncbi:MAG: formimidoylglutamate deiminase [Sandaracinus sp.]
MSAARLEGDRIVLPGLATVHSHAFQRAMRGHAQRAPLPGSFWSWREAMYRLADAIDPETLYDVSHFAFVELALAGVTCVGEFHYVHHQKDGTPYADRTALSDVVIRAALDAGLRITLLRVVYERAGFGRELESAQRRFSDASLELALADVETLQSRWAEEPRVRVGLAPHSLRAVTRASFAACVRFADERGLPLHAHVSEVLREVRECLAEHGRRPVEVLADLGALGPRFTAVHATHLSAAEVRTFGRSGSSACLCRTTERDLGDGFPDVSGLVRAGARIVTGTDSHASSCPFEEARAIELDERPRTNSRTVALDAERLLTAIAGDAYAALGWARIDGDSVRLDANDPALVGASEARPTDAVIFGAGPRAVREVVVAGRRIVEDGRHPAYEKARTAFAKATRAVMG